jgi:hypothetical protein
VSSSRLKSIKDEIATLSPEDRAILRKWFAAFDAAEWDRKTERDAASGKRDKQWLADAERRLAELESGQAAEAPADRILAEARTKSR